MQTEWIGYFPYQLQSHCNLAKKNIGRLIKLKGLIFSSYICNCDANININFNKCNDVAFIYPIEYGFNFKKKKNE